MFLQGFKDEFVNIFCRLGHYIALDVDFALFVVEDLVVKFFLCHKELLNSLDHPLMHVIGLRSEGAVDFFGFRIGKGKIPLSAFLYDSVLLFLFSLLFDASLFFKVSPELCIIAAACELFFLIVAV